MTQNKDGKGQSGIERRTTIRRPVLDSFSFSVALPRKGGIRLPMHDLSEKGFLCDWDTEGENPDDFPTVAGDVMEVHIYLNQSLFIPVQVRVARVNQVGSIRRIGVSILRETGDETLLAWEACVSMIDKLLAVGKLEKNAHTK